MTVRAAARWRVPELGHSMIDVIGLVIPFFGLIFVGAILRRASRASRSGAGLDEHVSSSTSRCQRCFFASRQDTHRKAHARWSFILGAVCSTYTVSMPLMFVGSMLASRRDVAISMIQGLATAIVAIGLQGRASAARLRARGGGTGRTHLLLQHRPAFTVAPSRRWRWPAAGRALRLVWRWASCGASRCIPFIVATAAGVLAAWLKVEPPLPIERLLEYLSNAAAMRGLLPWA